MALGNALADPLDHGHDHLTSGLDRRLRFIKSPFTDSRRSVNATPPHKDIVLAPRSLIGQATGIV